MDLDNKEPLGKQSNPAGLSDTDMTEDLKAGGCPICNDLEELILNFFAKWQYALTSDEQAQRDFAAELGFCPAHTWQLDAICSSRGISQGCSKLLERVAGELSKLIDSSQNWPNDISALIKGSESCRVCQLLQDREKMYARRLATFLKKEDGRVAYGHSHGVCLRHLRLLVSFLNSREDARFLLLEAVKNLRETAKDMQSYVWKHEALERHLINRNERYAYLRALVHIAGARNVCAPQIRQI
jgi:hypothetical protein